MRAGSPGRHGGGTEQTDWQRWHEPYEDPDSAMSAGLRAVQEQVAAALDRAAPGPVRLLSLCAGQGRDVLPVLADSPRGGDVTGRLVELDPGNAAAARAAAPAGVEVVQRDAGARTSRRASRQQGRAGPGGGAAGVLRGPARPLGEPRRLFPFDRRPPA